MVRRMPNFDEDIVIVGGGLAGLSLAVHLHQRGVTRSVRILEARTRYVPDRTWCGFEVQPHPFSDCIHQRWSKVRITHQKTVEAKTPVPYAHIDAEDFYSAAHERSAATLDRGVRVFSIEERAGFVHLETNAGALRARQVFDARPPKARPTAGFTQRFRGWFVRTERPLFDPNVATLMEFVPGAREPHFFYQLPFSPHRALIEDTWFTRGNPGFDEACLDARLPGGYEIERVEEGAIPMHLFDPQDTDRVRRIGLAGGVARPSTGYAFDSIQRHSAAIADALSRNLPPPRHARPNFLDAVFLRVLAEHPERGAEILFRLFDRNPPARWVRFLTETGRPLDHLGVMASLPKVPFVRAALQEVIA